MTWMSSGPVPDRIVGERAACERRRERRQIGAFRCRARHTSGGTGTARARASILPAGARELRRVISLEQCILEPVGLFHRQGGFRRDVRG